MDIYVTHGSITLKVFSVLNPWLWQCANEIKLHCLVIELKVFLWCNLDNFVPSLLDGLEMFGPFSALRLCSSHMRSCTISLLLIWHTSSKFFHISVAISVLLIIYLRWPSICVAIAFYVHWSLNFHILYLSVLEILFGWLILPHAYSSNPRMSR